MALNVAGKLLSNQLLELILEHDKQLKLLRLPHTRTEAGIVASTTQTQAGGRALTEINNEVATVASANDTVTLPSAGAGKTCVIINNGANTLKIYPALGDNLGAGVDTSTTLAAGSNRRYFAFNNVNWEIV